MSDFDINSLEKKMVSSIDNLKLNFQGVRSGRASTSMVDNLIVDAYGQNMKIKDLATVSVPEARTIKINVWDTNLINLVEKAISNSNLELFPMAEGQVIRINIPDLTAERRAELAKNIRAMSEDAKIAIRNIRQDGMNNLKKEVANNSLPEDDQKSIQDNIQSLTDKHVNIINDISKVKETEILTI
jgi:ribosome recycling factor